MFNTKYSKRNILLSPLLGGVEKVHGRVYLHAPQHFQEEEVVALTQILLLFLIAGVNILRKIRNSSGALISDAENSTGFITVN